MSQKKEPMTPQQYLQRCAQAWNATLKTMVNPSVPIAFVQMHLHTPFVEKCGHVWDAMGILSAQDLPTACAEMWTIYQEAKYVDADLMPRSLKEILNND